MYDIYLFDGSFEGLLTAIFYAYPSKNQIKICSIQNYTPDLISSPKEIKTELDKFQRVYSSIRDKLSLRTLRNIYYLYLSEISEIEILILQYIRLCYKYGDDINLAKNNDIISSVDKYCRRVSIESHRFTGFVRFKKLSGDIYYSSIEPDYNILPIITEHFVNRFSDQKFIIHDLKRECALVYNNGNSTIVDFPKNSPEVLTSGNNDNFESLWKTFYTSTNIRERENTKLQKMHMPPRYWQHIVETQK